MLKTVIIDNQNLFKEGFRLILENMEQQKFKFYDLTIDELCQRDKEVEVDLIFIELNIELAEQQRKIRKVKRQNKNARIAILSNFDNTKIVRETFQSGVDAFFLKSTTSQEVYEGLKEIWKGNTFMTNGLRLTPKIGHRSNSETRQFLYGNHVQVKQKLTKREREVLEHIVQAKSNVEIGELLFISEQTVGVHKKNIMRKLGVHNTVSLVRFAIDHNLA